VILSGLNMENGLFGWSDMSAKDNPLVSVIVLNYNGREVLEPCLDSIFASSYSPFEVIVVDNGSTDWSADIARKKYDFRLLRKKHNVGFSAGNNSGIRAARGEFLVLLNYDTVVDPNWLSELVTATVRFGAGFSQPKILMLNDPRIINSTGISIHIAGFGLLRGLGEIDTGQYDREWSICAPHGACIFASKEALEKIGLLDEHFFAFNDDTDLGWRAQLFGYKVAYVPSARIYHVWGHKWKLKDPRKFYYLERNRLIMLLTNFSLRSLSLLFLILVLVEIFALGYSLLNGFLYAKIRGYSDLIRARNYIVARRNRIQKGRKIRDKEAVTHFTCDLKHPIFGNPVSLVNWICRIFLSKIMRSI